MHKHRHTCSVCKPLQVTPAHVREMHFWAPLGVVPRHAERQLPLEGNAEELGPSLSLWLITLWQANYCFVFGTRSERQAPDVITRAHFCKKKKRRRKNEIDFQRCRSPESFPPHSQQMPPALPFWRRRHGNRGFVFKWPTSAFDHVNAWDMIAHSLASPCLRRFFARKRNLVTLWRGCS